MTGEVLSPNMSLPVPGVSVTDGPQWATDLDNCLTLIDQHDHSPGYGVQITPSGLSINADLPIGGNNLTGVRSTRYDAQGSPIANALDIGCTYVAGVDLYFNDVDGNQIRLTQSGGIAGTPGSIANLTSPASAAYNSGSKTFIWESDANTAANMDFAAAILRNDTASSKGLTLQPPSAMAADYAITLPTLPGSTLPIVMSSSGAQAASQITGPMVATGTLPLSTAAARAYTTDGTDPGVGGICQAPLGTFSNSTSGLYLAEGTPCVLTTIGKTVEICIDSDGIEANPNVVISTGGPSRIAIFRDGVLLKTGEYNQSVTLFYPPTSFRWQDINAPAGTHTYQLYVSSAGGSVGSQGCVLIAKEVT